MTRCSTRSPQRGCISLVSTLWPFKSTFGARGASYRAAWLRFRRAKKKSNMRVAPTPALSPQAIHRLRRTTADLLDKVPEELRRCPEVALLRNAADRKVYDIVQLMYRAKSYEGPAKDYEFLRGSMEDHWRAGYDDVVRTLRHPQVLERPTNHEGVLTFDPAAEGSAIIPVNAPRCPKRSA
jgi:Patatin phospholipase